MRSLRFILPPILVVLIAVALGGQEERPKAVSQTPPSKTVRIETVRPAAGAPTLSFPAVSRAARRARLAFSIGGRLRERAVAEGGRVAAGQVVARLDVREQDHAAAAAAAALAEARARHAEVRRDLSRVAQLLEQGAATREEHDGLRSRAAAAAAAVAAARARLADAERAQGEGVLVAPFDGTVTAVFLEPGEHAVAARPVVELAGDGEVEALLDVPAAVATALERGTEVAVGLPALGVADVRGRIVSIGRAGGAAGRLFPVIVALGSGVPVGTSVEVELLAGGADALTVPVAAVVDPAGSGPVVFRLRRDDGVADGTAAEARVERVAVVVGALTGGRVVVERGLAAGDRVVVAGQRGLLDGDAVEIVR